MNAPLSRRRFFGAGAALSALAFGVPALARAGNVPAVTDAALLAILDRRISEHQHVRFYATCYCARCAAVRAKGYDCKTCGFRGEPTVFPCECDDDRQACNGGCVHGAAACPVCGDCGDGEHIFGATGDYEEARAAAALIRDLRAALRAREVGR